MINPARQGYIHFSIVVDAKKPGYGDDNRAPPSNNHEDDTALAAAGGEKGLIHDPECCTGSNEQTQEFLNLLADSIGTAKILLLVNYPHEYSHQWNSKTYYTKLRLDPLGPPRLQLRKSRRCALL